MRRLNKVETAVHGCNSWLSVWTLSCRCPVIVTFLVFLFLTDEISYRSCVSPQHFHSRSFASLYLENHGQISGAVTKSGTETWDLGLGDAGTWDAGTGDAGPPGRGTRGRGDAGTWGRGTRDVERRYSRT